jgi:hypothetical protein
VQCGGSIYWISRDVLANNWQLAFQSLIILTQSLNYTLSAAWIYTLCARTIGIYYLGIADELQRLARKDCDHCLDNEMVRCLNMFKHLSQATRFLHSRLELILLINCYCLVANLIYLMYYVTRFYFWKSFIIDGFSLVEGICRLFLICHSADSIRNSVSSNYFPVYNENSFDFLIDREFKVFRYFVNCETTLSSPWHPPIEPK